MTDHWTSELRLSHSDAYVRLADALETAVRNGRLAAGAKLPTHREMAKRLGVAVSTVTRGYAEAMRRGLIESTVGRGTFVKADARTGAPANGTGDDVRPFERMYLSFMSRRDAVDLSLNHPLRHGAGKRLRASLRMLARDADLDELVLYHPPQGRPDHRAAGAAWLSYLGVEAAPDDVFVVAGGQTALLSILIALARPGDVVLAEALTWPGALALAQALGIRFEPVAIDAEGLMPEAFEEACRRTSPRLLYTMPTLHNPTNATASRRRREEIVRIARAHGVVIVEDDAYGFLVEPRTTPYWDIARDISMYLTSLSKPVAPAMRIGYLAAPAALRRRLTVAHRATTVMASPILSELAARMIADGEAIEAAEFQAAAAQRRQRLADRILGPAGGAPGSLHRWLALPPGVRTPAFVADALAHGVAVTAGDVFSVASGYDPGGVRICLCAEPDEKRVENALNTLAQLVAADRSVGMAVV